MKDRLNLYGDVARPTEGGHGNDIASQRTDELDLLAVANITARMARSVGKSTVRALDIGCGKGGQAARMAMAGAQVMAIDVEDCADEVAALMREAGVGDGSWAFRQMGIEDIGKLNFRPEIVVCQRMIHYLRWDDALRALSSLRLVAADGAMLYLSASGMHSELRDGYADECIDVRERFAPLREDRAQHHEILLPVCLYWQDELAALAGEAGWSVSRVFRSDFGNVKLVACRD
jgi:SAM-dependent methyltransferase